MVKKNVIDRIFDKRSKGIKVDWVLLIFIIFFFVLFAFSVRAADECAHNVDENLHEERQALCNIDMDCSIYGNAYKCVTPETRMNDEVKDILEESTTLNQNFINAWKQGWNGVCGKIKATTTFPDCTKAEVWQEGWTGTLIPSDMIPAQYKQIEETEEVKEVEIKEVIVEKVVEKNISVPVYIDKIDARKSYVVAGIVALCTIIFSALIFFGLMRGHKVKFEACFKCGGFNVMKYYFRNRYYCNDCFRKLHFKRTQKRNLQAEIKKDWRKMVEDVDKK